MKKKLIGLFLLWAIAYQINAQGSYGNEIQARNNSNVKGNIGRVDVNLKVLDSALLAKLNAGISVTGTFWQATQPVSIATLPALAAGTNNIGDVDVLTVNGVAPAFGSGVRGATVQRVTIATDDVVPVTGTFWQATQPVSISGNQAVNVAQINGVTPLMGAGNTGTGSQRVTIATDQSAIPVTMTSTTITGTVAATQSGTWNVGTVTTLGTITNVVHVDDNAGSLTVDGTVAISNTTIDTKSGTSPVNTMNSASANSGLNSAVAFLFDDVSPTSITENNFGFGRMSANHNQYMSIRDAAGNERGVNVNASNQMSVSVDNTVTVASHAVTNAGTFAVQSTNQANNGVDIGDVTINNASGASAVNIQDGGNSITVDGTVSVNALTNSSVVKSQLQDNAGNGITTNSTTYTAKFGIDGNLLGTLGTAFTTAGKVDVKGADGDVFVRQATASNLKVEPAGNVAHDAGDSGNPLKIGGRAVSAEITAVANNDRSDFVSDLVGKQIVMPYAGNENFVSGAITTAMTSTTSTSLIAAPGAGLRNYITTIIVSNSHATVGTDIIIQDGSGGTTLMTIPAAAVYGGAVINLPVPLRQPTTNTAIYCANVTTGASTKVSAVGYKGY